MVPDSYSEQYATVDNCAGTLDPQRPPVTPESPGVGPASSGPKDGSFTMVECELYSEPADALGGAAITTMPDISPYACFYGAPKHQVLKMGWLDKLSPQG